MDFYETLLEFFEYSKEFLPFALLIFVSFSCISFSIRFLKNLCYRSCCDSSSFFDDISDWIQERKAKKSESKKKGIVILESCVKQENELYKINLSKDKSGK